MRKLTVIVLLGIYAATQLGAVFFSFYQPVVHAISFSMQQQRMRSLSIVLKDTVLRESVYRESIVERDEIRLNGVLYDVRNIHLANGYAHLKLLQDDNETQWLETFSHFADSFRRHQSTPDGKTLNVCKWLLKIYCFGNQEIQSALPVCLLPELATLGTSKLNAAFLPAPAEPPEFRL